MLHLINHTQSESSALQACVQRAQIGDVVLLIENAVYEARGELAWLNQLDRPLKIYALQADLAARGIAEDQLACGVGVVDYHGFVELVETHSPIQSWF